MVRLFQIVANIVAMVVVLIAPLENCIASDWQAPVVLDGASPVTAEELAELMKGMDNLVLIDNREQRKFEQGTISGSFQMLYTQTSPDALAKLAPSKQTPIVFYCDDASCPHSVKAIRKAVSYGYLNIFWLRGGIAEWKQKGLPLVTAK